MTQENHDIPEWQIPDGEHILTEDESERGRFEEEKKLNQELDTGRTVYAEEPDDGLCPYCGCEYERASWASRVKSASKGVCPYDTSISDFIIQFVHQHRRDRDGKIRGVQCFCGPEHDDTLVTYPCSTDYDIKRI